MSYTWSLPLQFLRFLKKCNVKRHFRSSCPSICYGCMAVSVYVTCKFSSKFADGLGFAKGGTPSLLSSDAFGGAAVVVDGDFLGGDDVEIHRPGGIVVQPMDAGFVEVDGLAVTDFEGCVRGGTAPPALGISFRAWTTAAIG